MKTRPSGATLAPGSDTETAAWVRPVRSVGAVIERLRAFDGDTFRGWLPAAVWVVQPFLVGSLLGDALEPADDPFRSVASWGAWGWWLIVLVALAVPRPIALVVARVGVPAAVPAAIWAAAETDDATGATVGLVSAAIAALAVLAPGVADRFVDGASYGDERRFALRPPGPVLVAVLVPGWAVLVAGLTAGPLLLADGQWAAGAIALALGLPLAAVGLHALLRLADRFLVFVPNGLVVRDPLSLREPVLLPRGEIAGLAPAPADTTATDLTAAALGLALEVRLEHPAVLPVVTGRTTTEERAVEAVLISPSRPATVMQVAHARGITIA